MPLEQRDGGHPPLVHRLAPQRLDELHQDAAPVNRVGNREGAHRSFDLPHGGAVEPKVALQVPLLLRGPFRGPGGRELLLQRVGERGGVLRHAAESSGSRAPLRGAA
jgi:hypothetical protein